MIDSVADAEGSDEHCLNTLQKEEGNLFLQVKWEFDQYCDNLPIFGFNSSRYDLNLIPEHLLDILLNDYKSSPSIIKNCNKSSG